jgi:hypothetical protein
MGASKEQGTANEHHETFAGARETVAICWNLLAPSTTIHTLSIAIELLW